MDSGDLRSTTNGGLTYLELQHMDGEQSSTTESTEHMTSMSGQQQGRSEDIDFRLQTTDLKDLEAARIRSKSIDLVFEGRPRISAFPSISNSKLIEEEDKNSWWVKLT